MKTAPGSVKWKEGKHKIEVRFFEKGGERPCRGLVWPESSAGPVQEFPRVGEPGDAIELLRKPPFGVTLSTSGPRAIVLVTMR